MVVIEWLSALALAFPFFFPSQTRPADTAERPSVVKQIDAVYAAMPPLKYAPPADRWSCLPKTMKRLREGDTLRVVMLGDSIVNDTSHSGWEKLLERQYPKCRVEKVTSVRGSTGCWWYKEQNRVKPYVLDHKPDLVLIGGISQRGDVESIREVIRQIRAASEAEILVMTGAFGSMDPRKDKDWTLTVDPKKNDYRANLMKMAAAEKVEFLDLTGPWGQYIRESGKDLSWFKRDAIHANERGFQVLGRILERYLAP